jgi:hypothetical protein
MRLFTRPTPGQSSDRAVPDAVTRSLASGEEIEVRYELKRAEAFATTRRLIVAAAEGDPAFYDYDRISAVREISRVNNLLILAGVALFALGGTSTLFPVGGAVLIMLGIFARSLRVELLVTGVKEPVVLNGAREVLEPLAQRLVERGSRRLTG